MKKNNNSTSTIVNITGNDNTVIINGSASLDKASKKKKLFKTWLKALGKLTRSAFVNISVLLIEIFAKLG